MDRTRDDGTTDPTMPSGFVAVQQTPLAALTEADVGRHVFAAVHIYRGVQFKLGKLTRFFSSGRYAKKYNFDVLFVGEQGPRGMYLERDGETTKYDALAATNAIEGTWFFLEEL